MIVILSEVFRFREREGDTQSKDPLHTVLTDDDSGSSLDSVLPTCPFAGYWSSASSGGCSSSLPTEYRAPSQ